MYPGVVFLGHRIGELVYVPTSSAGGFSFAHIFAGTLFFPTSFSQSDRYEVVSDCFNLHSLITDEFENILDPFRFSLLIIIYFVICLAFLWFFLSSFLFCRSSWWRLYLKWSVDFRLGKYLL